jgi:DNA-binding transcriptional LysR family regulator
MRHINLNLLPIFSTLLESKSVSQAAQTLNMTQPAVTYSIKKLREIFKDELFIRTGHGITPTLFALELKKELAPLLNRISRLYDLQPEFTPAASRRNFKIGISEYAALTILKPLLQHCQTLAPHITFVTQHINRYNGLDKLIDDNLDMIIGNIGDSPKMFQEVTLYNDYFVVLACKKNKNITDRISLEAYQTLPHVKIALNEDRENTLDEFFAKKFITRNTVCIVTQYMLGLSLIPQSEKIITEPFLFALPWLKTLGLKVVAPPLTLPKIMIKMIWPRTYDSDPAHTWLREQLHIVAKSLPPQ